MKTIFLVLSVLITLVAVVPYLRDILKGTTKPNLVSWITWSLLTGVATIAEFAAGEHVAAIFTGAACVETLAVVVFGLGKGFVKYTAFDVWCQVGALVGFALWWLFNSPAVAVMAAVTIDLIGALPTMRHSWLAPHEETWQTFALSGLGGCFALLALSSYNWTSLPYAVYIVLANVLMTGIILSREKLMSHEEAR